MAAAETTFEYLAVALEATKGTAIANPTHYLPIEGSIVPVNERYYPSESRGLLAEYARSKIVRRYSTWSGQGGLDPDYVPLIGNIFIKGGVTAPTTPVGATDARLWEFTPTMTADDLLSATLWFGDPNVGIWRAAYAMGETLNIAADASGTDAATWDMAGFARSAAVVAAPTLPAQNIGSLLMPGAMQLWIDQASAIGTTEIEGRFISTNWALPTGVTRKHYAGGPTGGNTFTKHGRGKRHPEATITVELNDLSLAAEYAQWDADDPVKMRIRLNGDLIEAGFYNYVELDIVGPLDAFGWGTVENTNRTMTFTVMGMYDSTMGSDYSLKAQNEKTTV